MKMVKNNAHIDAIRARIVSCASALFRSQGIGDTSISEVGLDAGVSRSEILCYFPSKEELVCAVLDTSFDDVAGKLQEIMEPNGGRAALEPFVREYLSLDHARHPDRGCPIATMGIEAVQGPQSYRDAIDRGRKRVIQQLARGFDLPKQTAHRKASALLAALVGAVVMARCAATDDERETILTDTLETLLESLWSSSRQ